MMIDYVDYNDDGIVQLPEAMAMCEGDEECMDFTAYMFDHIDTDGYQGVDADELTYFLENGPGPYGGYGPPDYYY